MARAGLKAIPLRAVASRLRRERAGNRDVYAPLTDLTVSVAEPLLEPHRRFRLRGRIGGKDEKMALSPTALSQRCAITGVPVAFVERAPASLAAKSLRCFAEMAAGDVAKARATTVSFDDDVFAVRLVFDEEVNLGTARHPDAARLGVDVLTSETGCHPLEVRFVVFRAICSNGMTQISSQQESFRRKYTRMDRGALRTVLRSAVKEVFSTGREMAERLAETRGVMAVDMGPGPARCG